MRNLHNDFLPHIYDEHFAYLHFKGWISHAFNKGWIFPWFFLDRAVLGLLSVWPRMAWVGLGHPRTLYVVFLPW